jgi:hypothetical protein
VRRPAIAVEAGKLMADASMMRAITRPSMPSGAHSWSSEMDRTLSNPHATPKMSIATAAPGSPPTNGTRAIPTAEARNAATMSTAGRTA